MGNICRSPTAEGVFRALVKEKELSHLIEIDSAGTHAHHEGERPDPRSQKIAKTRGVELKKIRARKVISSDLEQFDYILAMDSDNHIDLLKITEKNNHHKVHLFLKFTDEYSECDVPDPYYGGPNGFDRVYDMVESASEGLLAMIEEKHIN